jgi:hypothetical protein
MSMIDCNYDNSFKEFVDDFYDVIHSRSSTFDSFDKEQKKKWIIDSTPERKLHLLQLAVDVPRHRDQVKDHLWSLLTEDCNKDYSGRDEMIEECKEMLYHCYFIENNEHMNRVLSYNNIHCVFQICDAYDFDDEETVSIANTSNDVDFSIVLNGVDSINNETKET